MFKKLALFIVATVLAVAGSASAASVPALQSFTGGFGMAIPDQTFGWRFTLSSSLTVTDLGFYDEGVSGVAEPHAVGIYSDAGALVTSVTVLTSDPLEAGFRYRSITPTVLAAGTYRIGWFGGNGIDKFMVSPSEHTTIAELTYEGAYFSDAGGTSLAFPSLEDGASSSGFFGPNFKVGAAVPAPAALPAGLALLGLVAMKRRK